MEQAPVDPVHQQSTLASTMPQLQPAFPSATAPTQSLGSAVEVALALEPLVTVDPLSPQHAPPSVKPLPTQHARPAESPTFRLGLQNQTVTSGDAAVFTVFFDGHPRPTVQWSINGRLVHSSRPDDTTVVVDRIDGVEVVEDLERGTSTLTILSSSVDHEAQYTCCIHNCCGTAFTNAHLFVLGIFTFYFIFLLCLRPYGTGIKRWFCPSIRPSVRPSRT